MSKRPKKTGAVFSADMLLKTRSPILQGTDPEKKRAEILEYFHKTFTLYESLFECLKNDEAFLVRANPLRHPLIFYYGHTAVFFINKLNVMGYIQHRVNPKLESMLAVGVDETAWDDLNGRHYHWPTPAEVKAYRETVRDIVDNFIRTANIPLPVDWNDPFWIIMMGIEHERLHLELSAVLLRELPLHYVTPHPLWKPWTKTGTAPDNMLLPVKGGKTHLGKGMECGIYGWDNEFGRKTVEVAAFKAAQYLVSNQEYLAFMQDGGYTTKSYWTTDGWKWAAYKKARHPAFWVPKGKTYRYRTMLEVIDMPWDWPVDINYLEAKAFCNWKSKKTGKQLRMPTEAEWHLLWQHAGIEDEPYWKKAPGNIALEHGASSCPVTSFPFKGGFYDIVGNVWQWTESVLDCFEGFKTHPAYDDFSTPMLDGKHHIFKGGCWVSTGNYAIRDSRHAFRRHFLQNTGLRYIEAAPLPPAVPDICEMDPMITRAIEFHYGEEYFKVPNFPKTCAEICLHHMKNRKTRRALDLGCGSGRASFILAQKFAHVDGIDLSVRLIHAPTTLQKTGAQRYATPQEGELLTYKTIQLESVTDKKTAKNIQFAQGDACNLTEKYKNYDLVFAGNLIECLYNPKKFLGTIHTRIKKGGLLILTSSYAWQKEVTHRKNWIGGFKAATGESYTTLEGLKDMLNPAFELIDLQDIPYVQQETGRTFLHGTAQMSVWQKK
jgi:5-histidylcysteine sulfoxide synthase/putative 4-mercaptohistidine N1-methyltranferase